MTRNPDRHIGLIEYDSFNNPCLIQFTDGSVTEYVYDASGVKLKTLHRTAVPGIDVPYGTVYEHTSSTVLSSDSTLYAGPFVLSGDSLRYKYDGGSVLIPLDGSSVKPCFYALDHLGSVRLVVSADGQVIERNDYYPSGCLITENIDGETVIMPYKYTGKELDPMHGLYTYDYGARQYDPATMLWDRMDPLCENTPEVSPYVYCGDNPVNAIDPDGKEIRIAWNLRKGKNIIQRYFVYKGGKLYYANGQLYTGKIEYVRKVQDSLNKLTKDDFQLAYRVKELENSKEIHTIAIGDSKINGNSNIPLSSYKDKNHLPTGSNTSYDPDAYHAINGIKRSPEVGLAHELLGHAYNTDKGTTDYSVTPTGVARYEVQAVNIENVARAANKEPKRTKYGEAKIPQKELWNTHK